MSGDACIAAIGEVLWDSLPDGLFLGGAPFNVAYHLNALGRRAYLVSRVGRDVLGKEVLARMDALGMPRAGVAVDPRLPTGLVRVRLEAGGVPRYEIVEGVAWDAIRWDAAAARLLENAAVVVFGSLAQRGNDSRGAIREAWKSAELRCFDVNLRPPFDSQTVVLESLEAADVVKLNEQELLQLVSWTGTRTAADLASGMEALAARFRIETLCVTRGPAGAVLLHDGAFHTHPGYQVEVADTVGAGDAFLAAFLDAYLDGEPPPVWLECANRLASYVASSRGATPPGGRDRLGPA